MCRFLVLLSLVTAGPVRLRVTARARLAALRARHRHELALLQERESVPRLFVLVADGRSRSGSVDRGLELATSAHVTVDGNPVAPPALTGSTLGLRVGSQVRGHLAPVDFQRGRYSPFRSKDTMYWPFLSP